MHLVVVDHAADTCCLESLEVGGDALAGGLRLAEELHAFVRTVSCGWSKP
jgi:hypothetical protein